MARSTQSLLWLVILFELSPAGHAVRLAALAWSHVAGGGPAAGAIAYGGTTFAIEAASALAAAVLVTSPPSTQRRFAAAGRDRLSSWLADRGPVRPVFVPGLAVLGGSAATTWVRHLGPVKRTRAELVRFGLLVSLGLGALSALQGGLIALGVAFPAPATIGIAIVCLAAVPLAAHWDAARHRRFGYRTSDIDGAPR